MTLFFTSGTVAHVVCTAMTDPLNDARNPLFIPTRDVQRPHCIKCGSTEFSGRNLGGVVTFTCSKCQNQWQGGLPQIPQDPTTPVPPMDPKDVPVVRFVRNNKGDFEEVRRRTSPMQPFRGGAPVPKGDE